MAGDLTPSFFNVNGGGVLDLRCLCPLTTPKFHLLGVHVGGSRIKKRIYQGVVPATGDLAGDLLPSFCLWGAVLVFVAIVPWPLLRSVVWVYLWGALAST